MSYPINYPTPQGANVQIFNYGANQLPVFDWIKPQGASFVWFTLIGAGGAGGAGTGGGSGAVTNFMCPAFLIPDMLRIQVGNGGVSSGSGVGNNAVVQYQQKDGTGYTLLEAAGAATSNGGSAMSANAFTAMGFFQSVAGQSGAGGNLAASGTTFLSGGTGAGATLTANYGYSIVSSGSGFFMLQPIIVGIGGVSGSAQRAGIGCGGSGSGGSGGNGLVVIITW
jgi:hypothetical protein